MSCHVNILTSHGFPSTRSERRSEKRSEKKKSENKIKSDSERTESRLSEQILATIRSLEEEKEHCHEKSLGVLQAGEAAKKAVKAMGIRSIFWDSVTGHGTVLEVYSAAMRPPSPRRRNLRPRKRIQRPKPKACGWNLLDESVGRR